MGYDIVTPPTTYPLSLQEAKLHCDNPPPERDAQIQSYIKAATRMWEKLNGRSIMATTWRLNLDCFPRYALALRINPVSAVSSIKYYLDDVLTTLDAADYQVSLGEPARIAPVYGSYWPTPDYRMDAVQVNFVAGYATAPDEVKHGLLMLVKHWYEQPAASISGTIIAEVPHGFRALLSLNKYGGLR